MDRLLVGGYFAELVSALPIPLDVCHGLSMKPALVGLLLEHFAEGFRELIFSTLLAVFHRALFIQRVPLMLVSSSAAGVRLHPERLCQYLGDR